MLTRKTGATPPYAPTQTGRAPGTTKKPVGKPDPAARRAKMREAAFQGLGQAMKTSQDRQAELDRNIDEMDRAALARMGQAVEPQSSALGRFSPAEGFAKRRRGGV